MKIGLVFPHQLFENHELFQACDEIFLIEEPLFFSQYKFHKKKIILHRASMKAFLEEQSGSSSNWHYISHEEASSENMLALLASKSVNELLWIDTVDFNLEKKIRRWAKRLQAKEVRFESPNFYNTESEIGRAHV